MLHILVPQTYRPGKINNYIKHCIFFSDVNRPVGYRPMGSKCPKDYHNCEILVKEVEIHLFYTLLTNLWDFAIKVKFVNKKFIAKLFFWFLLFLSSFETNFVAIDIERTRLSTLLGAFDNVTYHQLPKWRLVEK